MKLEYLCNKAATVLKNYVLLKKYLFNPTDIQFLWKQFIFYLREVRVILRNKNFVIRVVSNNTILKKKNSDSSKFRKILINFS